MIKAVFDTVVVLRAYINPRSRWGRLLARHTTAYRLVISPPLVAEYLDVVLRPALTRRFATLAQFSTATLFGLLADAEAIRLTEVSRVGRDPKDDMVLATAKTGGASYIVSEDRDLLDLVTYDAIAIVTAQAFLDLLGEDNGETG